MKSKSVRTVVNDTWIIIRPKFIKKFKDGNFLAMYKNHEIEIVEDGEFDSSPFYATVTAPNGAYIVDGYFWITFDDVLRVCVENILRK